MDAAAQTRGAVDAAESRQGSHAAEGLLAIRNREAAMSRLLMAFITTGLIFIMPFVTSDGPGSHCCPGPLLGQDIRFWRSIVVGSSVSRKGRLHEEQAATTTEKPGEELLWRVEEFSKIRRGVPSCRAA